MSESRATTLIGPDAACLIWADLLPDAPDTGTALLRRTERGTGPPAHLVDGPGTGRRMYDPDEVRQWCLDQQPPKVRAALLEVAMTAEQKRVRARNLAAAALRKGELR